VMSRWKLNHVPELAGAANYHGWSSAMHLDLQSAGLWNHVSEGVNILDALNYASFTPLSGLLPRPFSPNIC